MGVEVSVFPGVVDNFREVRRMLGNRYLTDFFDHTYKINELRYTPAD
jgi:hypothetical protein